MAWVGAFLPVLRKHFFLAQECLVCIVSVPYDNPIGMSLKYSFIVYISDTYLTGSWGTLFVPRLSSKAVVFIMLLMKNTLTNRHVQFTKKYQSYGKHQELQCQLKLIYEKVIILTHERLMVKLTLMWFSQALRVNWEQLLTAIARNINEVENQVNLVQSSFYYKTINRRLIE